MNAADCCLTIVLPESLEEELVDFMLERPDQVSRFVIVRAEGTGQGIQLQGLSELVRGRSPRVQFQVILGHEDARQLIGTLKAAFPTPEIAYWMTPLLEYGRFA